LFSRVATLPLLVQQLLVIQVFVYPSSYVDSLWLGSCMLLILIRGPGKLSLDYLLERYFVKWQQSAP
jgi:putative oxidoreductase